jgi:hypothetical protein
MLVAHSGVVKGRWVTGFRLREKYPVVVDDNLISSRHPDDMPHFTDAIRAWLLRKEGVR